MTISVMVLILELAGTDTEGSGHGRCHCQDDFHDKSPFRFGGSVAFVYGCFHRLSF